MLFQFAALFLLSFRGGAIDLQALTLAVCLPAATLATAWLMRRLWPIDEVLLLLVLFLCSVSVVTLQDIARSPQTPREQAVFMLVGIVVMFFSAWFIRRLRRWERWFWPLMGLSAAGLALPIVHGVSKYGAYNWISIFGVSAQPSEFVKFALVLVLAIGLSRRDRALWRWAALAFSAAMCGMLLVQRDLGALLIYFFTTLMMYFIASSNLLVTLGGLAAGAGGAVVAYNAFDYVKKRVAVFQNPWSDPRDAGYQIVQALVAIGSGGMFGMGLGLGMPRNIPLYHSDFVFAAICEEFGYLFALCLLMVYVLIAARGIRVAMNARAGFHALAAAGVSALLGVQTLIIVGGNIKLIPLTGVTLPFVAAGGSSLISCFACAGLLLGISSINEQYEREDIARAEWREAMLE